MDGRKDYRVEMDSVGAKDVPENVYYGVQSMRAAENFQITGLNMHPEIINSLAYIKKAAAITNMEKKGGGNQFQLLKLWKKKDRHATRFWKAGFMRTLLLTPFRAGLAHP